MSGYEVLRRALLRALHSSFLYYFSQVKKWRLSEARDCTASKCCLFLTLLLFLVINKSIWQCLYTRREQAPNQMQVWKFMTEMCMYIHFFLCFSFHIKITYFVYVVYKFCIPENTCFYSILILYNYQRTVLSIQILSRCSYLAIKFQYYLLLMAHYNFRSRDGMVNFIMSGFSVYG